MRKDGLSQSQDAPQKKGAQAFYQTPKPRGRSAVDADKQAEAENLLFEGKSIGKTAAELGIHHSTLRHNVKMGWIESPSATADAGETEAAISRNQRNQSY